MQKIKDRVNFKLYIYLFNQDNIEDKGKLF